MYVESYEISKRKSLRYVFYSWLQIL